MFLSSSVVSCSLGSSKFLFLFTLFPFLGFGAFAVFSSASLLSLLLGFPRVATGVFIVSLLFGVLALIRITSLSFRWTSRALGGELPLVTDRALVTDLLLSLLCLAHFILGDCVPVCDLSRTLRSPLLSLILPFGFGFETRYLVLLPLSSFPSLL